MEQVEGAGLKGIIARACGPLAVLYVLYSAYDLYFVFPTDASSPTAQKASQIKTLQDDNVTLSNEVKAMEEFVKMLPSTTERVREAGKKLGEMKTNLSDVMDAGGFMKLIEREAKRVGVTILGIKSLEKIEKTFYVEQPFEVQFRGVFAQIYALLERISKVQRIIRVESFQMKPVTAATAKFVELEGVMQLKTYQYNESREDTLDQSSGRAQPAGAVTDQGSPAQKEGGP